MYERSASILYFVWFGLTCRLAHRHSDSKEVGLWPEINSRERCPPLPIQVQSPIGPVTIFCLSWDKAKAIT